MSRYSRRETIASTLTLLRLLLLWGFIDSYHRSFWYSLAWLLIIIVVDIYDGKIARFFEADGALRRMTDGHGRSTHHPWLTHRTPH
ncbi:MAG: CDP-alcohol phosphatidyltransferase family protein [Candidatus Saccharibacteria bacterium]